MGRGKKRAAEDPSNSGRRRTLSGDSIDSSFPRNNSKTADTGVVMDDLKEDFNLLTVAELKERLNSLGKKTTGKKVELVKRLTMAMASSGTCTAAQAPSESSATSFVVSGNEISITFLTFPWETLTPQDYMGNIWDGRSSIPLPDNEVSYWEVTVSNLEKQYQYEYTQLGIITAPTLSPPGYSGALKGEEKLYVDGLIGEITHSWCGPLRGFNEEGEGIYSTSSAINVSSYRIRLKDGDTIGFLADLRDPQNRTLTVIPRQNYFSDPNKPHTQPSLLFATQLLKHWESSTKSFGKRSVVGRIPPEVKLFAFASVGQLGKRLKQKLMSSPEGKGMASEYLSVRRWGLHAQGEAQGEREEVCIPPMAALEHLILTNPSTTLGPSTLSSTPYDPSLLEAITQAELEREER
jgi:hypothetical protein